jgi:hypothetical protein
VVVVGAVGLAGAAGDVAVVVRGVPPERLAAWVEASCAAQGVPPRVTDPALLRRVVVLLGGEADGPRAQARSASARPVADRSESPDRAHPVGVQGPGAGDAGPDDGVVEDRGDDGVLPAEVEAGPLGA